MKSVCLGNLLKPSWSHIICPEHNLVLAIQLEGNYSDRSRFLCIVRKSTNEDSYCILGIDEEEALDVEAGNIGAKLGLVIGIAWGMSVTLDGDGGFTYREKLRDKQFIFKPVSVQALWTVIQTFHMISERLSPVIRPPDSPTTSLPSSSSCSSTNSSTSVSNSEPWLRTYESRVSSSQSCINEWHFMADVLVRRPPSPCRTPIEGRLAQDVLRYKLREIMKACNLDTMTSKKIRNQLEAEVGHSLEEEKSFVDQEILTVLGQMDPASLVVDDYLYLGSEWNASNLEELKANRITHVLNVTREIDNFFPGEFTYKNIRVYDEESTDLLRHFEDTFRFIQDARKAGGRVLVHCKMGISRSATCVVSYIMKESGSDLVSALLQTKGRRPAVNPNKGFMKQLDVYEGILGAIRHRFRYIKHHRRSLSCIVNEVEPAASPADSFKTLKVGPWASVGRKDASGLSYDDARPKSWSPAADGSSNAGDCLCNGQTRSGNVETPTGCSACNVELELNVPAEPVDVSALDVHAEAVVQSLNYLRTDQADMLHKSASVPTFAGNRQPSLPLPADEADELSVNKLAEFNAKGPRPAPHFPSSKLLEDNRIFQRAVKQNSQPDGQS